MVPAIDHSCLQILAKILASGVCHSDLIVQSGAWGNPFPIIPGHEAIGEVVAVGPDEDHWKIGDRVGGAWHGGRKFDHIPHSPAVSVTVIRLKFANVFSVGQ